VTPDAASVAVVSADSVESVDDAATASDEGMAETVSVDTATEPMMFPLASRVTKPAVGPVNVALAVTKTTVTSVGNVCVLGSVDEGDAESEVEMTCPASSVAWAAAAAAASVVLEVCASLLVGDADSAGEVAVSVMLVVWVSELAAVSAVSAVVVTAANVRVWPEASVTRVSVALAWSESVTSSVV
jgi:hypothetical protein